MLNLCEGAVSGVHDTVVTTYRDDLSDVERHVATIGLQYDFGIVMRPIPDVREPSSGYWVLTDEFDVLRVKPTTGRWQGRSEILSHLHITLRRGRVVRVWSRRAPGFWLGWCWRMMKRLRQGVFLDNRGSSSTKGTKSREERHDGEGGRRTAREVLYHHGKPK